MKKNFLKKIISVNTERLYFYIRKNSILAIIIGTLSGKDTINKIFTGCALSGNTTYYAMYQLTITATFYYYNSTTSCSLIAINGLPIFYLNN